MTEDISKTIIPALSSILKGGLVVLLGTIFVTFSDSFVHFLLAKNLSVYDYGEISLTLTYFLFFSRISIMAMPTAATKFISNKPKDEHISIIKSIFLLTSITNLVSIIIIYFFKTSLPIFLQKLHIPNIFFVFIIFLPFFCLQQIIIGIFRGYKNPKYKFLIEGIQWMLLISFILISILLGMNKAFFIVLIWGVSYLLSSLLAVILLYKKTNVIGRAIFDTKNFYSRQLLKYAVPLLFAGTGSLLINRFDNIAIGYFLSSKQVGIYNITFKITKLLLFPSIFFGYIYLPIASKLLNLNKKVLTRITLILNKWILLLSAPIVFILIKYPGRILSFFSTEYSQGIWPLRILTIGFSFFILNGVYNESLKSRDSTKIIFYCTVLSAFVDIVLNVILTAKLGIIGSALATSISYTTLSLSYIYFGTKFLHTSLVNNAQIVQTIYAILIGLSLSLINFGINSNIKLLIEFLLFYILLFALNVFFKTFKRDEVLIFKKILKILVKI